MVCYLISVMITITTQNVICAGFNLDKDLGTRCIYRQREYPKIKFKDSYAVKRVRGDHCKTVLKAKR